MNLRMIKILYWDKYFEVSVKTTDAYIIEFDQILVLKYE